MILMLIEEYIIKALKLALLYVVLTVVYNEYKLNKSHEEIDKSKKIGKMKAKK